MQRLKPTERCPIPEHRGSLTCCGRGDFRRIKSSKHKGEVRVGSGVFRLPDGRERRTKAALHRAKKLLLKAGELCAGCQEGFGDFSDVELAHIESCGMNGHKRDDSMKNLTLMHTLENREQGSRSLEDYLADPNRIGLRKSQGENQ